MLTLASLEPRKVPGQNCVYTGGQVIRVSFEEDAEPERRGSAATKARELVMFLKTDLRHGSQESKVTVVDTRL